MVTSKEDKMVESLKLNLEKTPHEGLLIGIRKDGTPYSVRTHRLNFFMPDKWIKFIEALDTKRAKLTAEILIQTGARINEARHIEERDIDYERRTLRLRITKTKAAKGETTGRPRTIPISSQFAKYLKKIFRELPPNSSLKDIYLSTQAFNTAMKRTLKKMKDPEWYMMSPHNIRKTHGNWLKLMMSVGMMSINESEICLRLGHDYNTFLKDYGSSSVADSRDIQLIKKILGDLYERR